MDTVLKFFTVYYLQTDEQAEIVNHSHGNLLRFLMGNHLTMWIPFYL